MNTLPHQPLVSVVLATYNGARFLREQLDSIAAQSYKNIEILALDDGSTDATVDILQQFQASHPNLTVIQNQHNLGYQKNFEKGFLLAKGHFIAPCDQDDIWLPNKIATLVKLIGNYAIAYCNSALIDSDGKLLGVTIRDRNVLLHFDDPLMYVVGACAPGHAMLITKQVAMDAMPFPTVVSHDNWLGFIATFNSSLRFVDEVLVHYRQHDTNVFGGIKKKRTKVRVQERIQKARQRIKIFYDKCPPHLSEQKRAYYKIYKSYQSHSLKNNFARMCVFFSHRKKILAYKQRNEARRCLYCLKVFFKIM